MRSGRIWGLTIVAAAGVVRIAWLFSASAVITPDSYDYARQSQLPLLSTAFWGSQHPPLLPLLWKALPGLVAPGPLLQLGDIAPALFLNALVGAACWGFLAWTIAGLARHRVVAFLALAGILTLSLAPEVSGWDSAALSESIALSSLALLLALTTRYARDPGRRRALWLGAAVVAATLVRDTDLVLCALIVVPAALLVRRERAVLALAVVAAAALSLTGQHAGHRSAIPIRNAIGTAMLRHGDTAWFRGRGMPWQPGTEQLLVERPASVFEHDPRAAALRSWLAAHGREAWLGYLASHPARTLEIGRSLPVVYDPPRAPLATYWGDSPPGLFVRGAWFVALVLAGALGAVVARRRRATIALGCFLCATLPLAVAIWDADGIEYERHAAAVPILARIALLGLALLGADTLYPRLRKAAVSIPKYVGASYDKSSASNPSPSAP